MDIKKLVKDNFMMGTDNRMGLLFLHKINKDGSISLVTVKDIESFVKEALVEELKDVKGNLYINFDEESFTDYLDRRITKLSAPKEEWEIYEPSYGGWVVRYISDPSLDCRRVFHFLNKEKAEVFLKLIKEAKLIEGEIDE